MASKGSTKGADRGAVVAAAVVDRPEQDPQRRGRGPLRRRARPPWSRRCWRPPARSRAPARSPTAPPCRDHDPAAVTPAALGVAVLRPVRRTTGVKVNLLDTPGYADFVGELRAGPARRRRRAVRGLRRRRRGRATVALWEECAAVGMPRAVVVTRLDHPRADFDETVAVCQRVFGDNVLPLYLPMHGDDGSRRRPDRAADHARCCDYSSGSPAERRGPTRSTCRLIDGPRNELIEGIIAESEDETLMDRYLGGEEIALETLIDDLETAVARGTFYPVLAVCAADRRSALDALLEVLTSAFPSPLEHELPPVTGVDGSPREPLTCDPAGPLVAEVVKTTDRPVRRPGVAGAGLLRHAAPDRPCTSPGTGWPSAATPTTTSTSGSAHLFSPLGATLRRGRPSPSPATSARSPSRPAPRPATPLSAKDEPLLIAPWDMPEPLLPIAIVAKTRSDEDALAKNLARLVAGDPTLRLERNAETHQLVLWCMGEAHADVVLDRLRASGGRAGDRAGRRAAAGDVRGPGQAATAGTSSSPAGTASTRSATSRSSRCRPAVGFEFVDKVVGGVGAAQLHPVGGEGRPDPDGARRRRPGTRWSTSRSPWSTARRTASTRPTRRSRPPVRWRCGRRPRRHDLAARAGRRGRVRHGAGRVRRRGDERPVRPARAGPRHRVGPTASVRWSAPRCRRPSCCGTRWSCAR